MVNYLGVRFCRPPGRHPQGPLFTNYFLPQQKLVFKQRNGAKVTKRHDEAKTPHQRAVAHKNLGKQPIIAMNAAFRRIKPQPCRDRSWS